MDDTTYNPQTPSDTTEEHSETENFELTTTGYLAAGEEIEQSFVLGYN